MAARLKKIRLGDLLLQNGVVTASQLEAALAAQRGTGKKLGQVLVESGAVEEDALLGFLALQLHVPHIDLLHFPVDPQLVHRLPETYARRFRAIPLKREGNAILVGMSDPTDIFAFDTLARALGAPVAPAVVSERRLLELLPRLYGAASQAAGLREALRAQAEEMGPDAVLIETSAEEAPVVRLLNALFIDAVRLEASDIHIEPDGELLRVRLRVDGVLREHLAAEVRIAPAVASKLKLMANMDIAERRLPQDGRMRLTIEGKPFDIRVSTLPIRDGESVVLRLLDQGTARLQFGQLGMPPLLSASLEAVVRHPYGLFLVTGPTGSGKTTTLYAALNEINSIEKKIVTVEDPVEYQLERVNQVQVQPRIGLDFARVLRAVLRQDPDIVMVGEIRDNETAQIAARAALTGHLVLSTLHTNDAAGSLTRLMDLGVEPFLVASSTLGVMAQRLVRKICPQCREEDPDVPEALRGSFAVTLGSASEGLRFYRGRGCLACNYSGYRGRQAVFELIRVDRQVREAIGRGDRAGILAAACAQPQFHPLREAALRLVVEGVTTVAELARVTAEMED